jgi:hypothetical protein
MASAFQFYDRNKRREALFNRMSIVSKRGVLRGERK